MADNKGCEKTTIENADKGHENDKAEAASPRQVSPDYLGPFPVSLGENAKTYERLLDSLLDFYKPIDPVEWIHVRDICDLQWQAQRLRRAAANCLNNARVDGVERVLKALGHSVLFEASTGFDPGGDQEGIDAKDVDYQHVSARQLAVSYVKNDERARAKITELLQKSGLTEEAFIGEAMSVRIAQIERMDRSAMLHQACRDEAINNLRIHRANTAGLRRRELQIEDAEFRVVEHDPNDKKKAA
jgi:hypothetical protein